MRKTMMNIDSNRARRMQADREELAEWIARATRKDGPIEAQPGLFLNRVSTANETVYAVIEAAFCVIAQGSKDILIGDERLRYDPAQYLISTMELPARGRVVDASAERPYLSVRLNLDPSIVTSVMVESAGHPTPRGDGSNVRGVAVSALDADLLNATLRLVRLTEQRSEYRMLAPLVVREIVYRLLMGAQLSRIRHLATVGGHPHRMVRAVEKLRREFNKPLRIEEVAHELGMSVSGFHAHFKAVTAMSPLQFQKHLRIQEARSHFKTFAGL